MTRIVGLLIILVGCVMVLLGEFPLVDHIRLFVERQDAASWHGRKRSTCKRRRRRRRLWLALRKGSFLKIALDFSWTVKSTLGSLPEGMAGP